MTASADYTMRLWTANKSEDASTSVSSDDGLGRVGAYSLCNSITVTEDVSLYSTGTSVPLDMDDPGVYESLHIGDKGIRCITLTPSEGHIATGDKDGAIRIYDTNSLANISSFDAHEGEVLSLDFSSPPSTNGETSGLFLASASRDRYALCTICFQANSFISRLIHIFECKEDSTGNSKFELRTTLDDHSASVTSVRFTELNGSQKLVSCSADKYMIFRSLSDNSSSSGSAMFPVYHREMLLGAPSDMEVEPEGKEVLMLLGADKKVGSYTINNGKKAKILINNMEAEKDKGTSIILSKLS